MITFMIIEAIVIIVLLGKMGFDIINDLKAKKQKYEQELERYYEAAIAEIIKVRYHDYKGTAYKDIKYRHELMREVLTNEAFYVFLMECERNNPKPIYKLPDGFKP